MSGKSRVVTYAMPFALFALIVVLVVLVLVFLVYLVLRRWL
jgi:hypothetical protein